MAPRHAFFFDAASCSGCKACQAACKDKHALPVGLLWRRVHEVAGGGWTREGEAWSPDAFAYSLSIACNHCERPACVEACPTRAMRPRADGIVLIDPAACMGCRYCEWACPYGAPQDHATAGRMTKCTFCADLLDAGRPPACVAACPMRAIECGEPRDLEARHGAFAPGWPLPDPALTRPALVVRPHRHAARAGPGTAVIANREEVRRPPRAADDRPLVAFTLVMQLAVGAFLAAWAIDLSAARFFGAQTGRTPGNGAFLAITAAAAAALCLSFLHLGAPGRAWRSLANLRQSWLSREILFAFGFVVLSAGFVALRIAPLEWQLPRMAAGGAASLCGVALVYSMARVYRLRTMPGWDTPLTTLSFFVTCALGALAMGAATGLSAGGSRIAGLDAIAGSPAARSLLAVAMAASAAALVVARVRFFRLASDRPL